MNSLFPKNIFPVVLFLLLSCSVHRARFYVETVEGSIRPGDLGTTLIHEHVFLDWTDADNKDRIPWDEQEAFDVILPHLLEMKNKGVKSFLECTPAYLGRNPALLRKLSEKTGLHVLTNTGYYAARKQQYIPEKIKKLHAEDIASIWIDEFCNGIDKSGVKPGFIKIGVDSKNNLDSLDQKIVTAAALTHLATGLTIVSHTGDDTTAIQQLKIIRDLGVDPSAFVWTHAQRGTEEGHKRLARQGVWISLDGLGWAIDKEGNDEQLSRYINFLLSLKRHKLLHRTLISHDAGWYTVGKEEQTTYKGYTVIFDQLIPRLNKKGFTKKDWRRVLVNNPREAYKIRKSKSSCRNHEVKISIGTDE